MLISGITRQTLRHLRCSNPQVSTKVHRSPKSQSLTCRWNSPSQRLPDHYLQLQPFRTYCSLKEIADSIAKPTEEPHGNQRLTHLEAVDLMEKNGLVKCNLAYKVFSTTDPEHFEFSNAAEVAPEIAEESESEVTQDQLDEVYMDNWLHSAMTVIGIISVLDGLIMDGSKVLDLGCGNGYMTTILAKIVAPTGKVIAVDHDPVKLEQAKKTIAEHYPDMLPIIEFRQGDVFAPHEGGPFDAVHVGGAVQEVPQEWLALVKPGGSLIGATPEIEPNLQETQFMLRHFQIRKEGGVAPINMMFVNYEELVEPKL